MTIANGQPVIAAELNNLNGADMENLRGDNERSPGGVLFHCQFPGLVASTPARRSKRVLVIPVDMYVDSLAVQTTPGTAASTISVEVTGDGALPNFAMRLEGVLSSTLVKKHPRLLFDNNLSAKPGVDPALTSRVMRLLPKGSTITITVSTTNAVATMECQVTLCGRSYFARELT